MGKAFELKGINQETLVEEVIFSALFKNLPDTLEEQINGEIILRMQDLFLNLLQKYFPEQYNNLQKEVDNGINNAIINN